MQTTFEDRRHAGRVLAERLQQYAGRADVIVLALPRGGVPVGYEVARALAAPLGTFLVRKLGAPGHKELAMGAIAAGGVRRVNARVIRSLGIGREALEEVVRQEERELARREALYRGSAPALSVAGRTALLVDDGLATGSTMRVAVMALREKQPARIVVAVPVAAPATCKRLASEADEVVCAVAAEPFHAVGLWYDDFSQTSDEEVRELLERATRERRSAASSPLADPPSGSSRSGVASAG